MDRSRRRSDEGAQNGRADKRGRAEGGKTQGKGGSGRINEAEQRVEKHRVRVEEGG